MNNATKMNATAKYIKDGGGAMSPLEMAERGLWVDYCLNLLYARAWRERQEELDRQLQEFLRPHDEVEELKSQ